MVRVAVRNAVLIEGGRVSCDIFNAAGDRRGLWTRTVYLLVRHGFPINTLARRSIDSHFQLQRYRR